MRSTLRTDSRLHRRRFHSSLLVNRLEDRTVPTTFNVTNTLDGSPAPAGSMRAAVLAANANPGADVILCSSALSGTINLSAGEMSITETVSIVGPTLTLLTLNGKNLSGIFHVQAGSVDVTLNVSNLTLTGGKATTNGGGAIFGQSTFGAALVAVSNCAFTGNSAPDSTTVFGGGAISANTVSATDCTFTSNTAAKTGGAISAYRGSATLVRCTFTGNASTASFGGAVYTSRYGTLAMTDCTLTGNTALVGAGAISAGGYFNYGASTTLKGCVVTGNSTTAGPGGALYCNDQTLIQDCTFSNNTAKGGNGGAICGFIYYAALTIRNSTISGNSSSTRGGAVAIQAGGDLVILNSTITANSASTSGGGLEHFGSKDGFLSIESSILSGDSAPTGPEMHNFTGVGAYSSLLGSTAGQSNFYLDAFTTANVGVNPLLGPLTDNGGRGKTHPLLPGSPAIDHGTNPASLANDQRGTGFARTTGAQPDIGAYEVQPDFVVRNANDSGLGSLRLALLNAGGIPGPDTVTFDPAFFNVPRTITLTSGEIAVADAVTITGPGAALATISGNGASRVFNAQSALNGAAITIAGLTLQNASAGNTGGGAILAGNQNLSLSACTFTGNSVNGPAARGGAVNVGFGTLVATDCTFTNNTANTGGGAINVQGTGCKMTLLRCTVSGNSASGGGGVYAAYDMLVDSCTLSANKSAQGGGLDVFPATNVTIRNSTITGNSSTLGGGLAIATFGFSPAFAAQIQNCTITANTGTNQGGGVYVSGPGACTIESSIVFGDSATTGPEIFRSGTVTVNSSLVKSNAGVTTFTGDSFTNGNIGVDPLLSPLANNGGPTQTHALKNGSPALNHGSNPASLTNDQRGSGFPRSVFGGIDIGAFEDEPTIFAVLNANDSGAGSLRQAVLDANAHGLGDTILFELGFFNVPRTITLASTIDIKATLNITGPGAALVTVSGNNAAQIFRTNLAPTGAAINISGMTLTGGNFVGSGGAISTGDEALTLNKCVFSGNTTTGQFGGAISASGPLTAIDCTFTNNVAQLNGGAIYAFSSNVLLQRCTFSGNTANKGGAIELNSVPSALIEQCTLSQNSATLGDGGAIVAQQVSGGPGTLTLRNSTVSGNHASVTGGGIAVNGNTAILMAVQNSTITGNSASIGGGIRSPHSVSVESSIVFGDSSTSYGPEIAGASVTVSSSLIGSKSGAGSFTGDAFTNANIGVNPLLGPLANNGGPTLTHALLPGSPAINSGSNPAGLTNDQRGLGFNRSNAGAPDIGALESALPPIVRAVSINGDAAQRSRVTDINVTFDSVVGFSGSPVAAFSLKRQSDNAVVVLNAAVSNGAVTSVALTFLAGPAVDFGSLADGRYTLTIDNTKLIANGSHLDGNSDGVAGDDFVLVGNPATNKLFRLYGDADGNGLVDGVDFGAFRTAFNTNSATFDFDGSGIVDGVDFGQFRQRFGMMI